MVILAGLSYAPFKMSGADKEIKRTYKELTAADKPKPDYSGMSEEVREIFERRGKAREERVYENGFSWGKFLLHYGSWYL